MLSAITDRRSIRKYKDEPIPKHMLEEILRAGILAPSGRNRQPWEFTVVTGGAKKDALSAMRRGLEREKEQPMLPETAQFLSGAEHSAQIMEQAGAIIFIVNPYGAALCEPRNIQQHVDEICDLQSVGAAIENMMLTATELGLGSLWICNTFYAYRELCDWLGGEGVLLAAMAVGYADERPAARPRKSMDAVVRWRT